MGCNLCTLRRREEHYKLLYEIAQVNGKDLSKASHEEAVEAFRSAKDPIVVQVLRRNPASRCHGNPQEVHLVDVCTQTDITFEHIMALSKLRPATPPLPDICPFLLSDSCHSFQTMEQEFYEDSEYLSHIPADGDRGEEFEYEEVELCRLNSQEKLGLTVCYRTDDEEDIGIYVSEVGLNSIAARDGRIREGDRILQINGQDVQDKEEAVTMLSNEDCRNILLLVARPEMQLDEGWLDDEQNEFLEELKMEMLEEQRKEEVEQMGVAVEQAETQEGDVIVTDAGTCSSVSCDKSSGTGPVSESGRLEESSERDVLARVHRTLSQCRQDRREGERSRDTPADTDTQSDRSPGAGGRLDSESPPAREEEEEDEEECERFQQLLELKCAIRNSGEYDLLYTRRSTVECSLTEQEGVQRELRLLNEELRSIERECQNIMQAHQLRQTRDRRPGSAPGSAPAPPQTAEPVTEQPERSDKDSSSAYNTAESSRSTPLAMDRSPDHSLQRTVSAANRKNLCGAATAGHARQPAAPAKPGSPRRDEASEPGRAPPAGGDRDKPCPPPAPYLSPYHSSQFRHANIPAHARHYQSYMQLVQQRSAVEYAQSQLSLLSVSRDAPRGVGAPEPRAEWKVKVRGDGTRYITKRPVRDRLLRERALRIREERGGTTTDDDAASELKMGRYWSKEERKQHLLRAREQRRRREFMMRSRLESLRESPQSGGEGRKEVSILELSHRKMLKKRNRKILDNWMTIQELMSHGARTREDARLHNAFLSVTTV
ncbi:hypothetical protein MATL_G00262900 [Megalops atlanticus]|uniref:PDZ domain-containing protein n=1 Tax=Megalops atlanticus TaxID=7932 RepID=A0A9D3P925_MEGAT|nr:hypothetical protein MATL_G00262900 [Megalops atlanticus]